MSTTLRQLRNTLSDASSFEGADRCRFSGGLIQTSAAGVSGPRNASDELLGMGQRPGNGCGAAIGRAMLSIALLTL